MPEWRLSFRAALLLGGFVVRCDTRTNKLLLRLTNNHHSKKVLMATP